MATSVSRRTLFVFTVVAVGLGMLAHQAMAQAPAFPGGHDAACVAQCATARDRAITFADKTLKERGYYSTFSSNCTTAKGQPICPQLRQICREACAPKYDNTCLAACETPFQNCCYTNEVDWRRTGYSDCVAGCPKAIVPSVASVPGLEAAGQAMMPWGEARLAAWEALQNKKSAAERSADDARRAKYFDQVRARLSELQGSFALVAGGGGRLWVVKADGTQLKLSNSLTGMLRSGIGRNKAQVIAALIDEKSGLGFGREDAEKIAGSVEQYSAFSNGKSFGDEFMPNAPDNVMFYSPGESFPNTFNSMWASSEHSSIRGSINGGGDFI